MKGHITREIKCTQKQNSKNTRMVQLPATTAIEYVAACLPGGTFSRGSFGRGIFVRGAYVRWAYARSPLEFNAYMHRQGLGVDPRSPNFQGM